MKRYQVENLEGMTWEIFPTEKPAHAVVEWDFGEIELRFPSKIKSKKMRKEWARQAIVVVSGCVMTDFRILKEN